MKEKILKCPHCGKLIKGRFTNKKKNENSPSQSELRQKWGIELGIVDVKNEEVN